MVSMLAVYSDDPSSNTAEAYSFFTTLCLKRKKIKKVGRGWPTIKNNTKEGAGPLNWHFVK